MTEFEIHQTSAALPGEATPITAPGEEPETRNDDDSIERSKHARFITRRRLLLFGGSCIGAAASAWLLKKDDWPEAEQTPSIEEILERQHSPTPEKPPIPIELTNLYKYQNCKPETLNAPTFEEVADHMFCGIQYGMATNNKAVLKQLIPGPPAGDFLADQLMFRASFYENLRKSGPNTDPSSPACDKFRCNVASITSYDGLAWSDAELPFDATLFKLKVHMTIQEAPPLLTDTEPAADTCETCKPFATTLTFSRYGGLVRAGSWDRQEFTDINGEGRGWALIGATDMVPISSRILAQRERLPSEFPVTPPIWANYSYTPK